ncbi:MAG TPA: Plug domain-containing protein [Gemmatimonadaceae bacterium]|nr:Plug domain-containing protein [Gemmatimonadaceae bacterium]
MSSLSRLGLIAGALLYALPSDVLAQVVPAPASEVPMPVKPKTDSAQDSAKVKTDTVKAPIGRFADPVLYEIGPQYDWNREQMFATGALNLGELLDRIPQVTSFRSGWLATPHTAAFNGDFRRVRIFYDGIELDNLDNFTGGVLDLTTVPIWTLEHVSIERSASELRVFLRTWRVNNTTPYTRADIATGNEETNLYRGFYGKRFDNGGVLQLAGQQFGVQSSRFAGGGDGLSLLARVGVAKKSWSVDGFVTRSHATRDIERPIGGTSRPPILALDATHTDAYLRAAVGAVEGGPWIQLVAASLGFKGTTRANRSTAATSQPDTTERRVSESQFNLSGGYTKGPLRFEFRDRLRTIAGSSYNGVSGRVDIVSPLGVLTGFVEQDGFRKLTNADVGMRAQPLPFVAVSGSVATSRPTSSAGLATTTSARGEAAVKLFGPWVGGGFITSDKTAGLAPLAYDTLLLATPPGRTSGFIGSIRGPLWRGIGIDSWITRWSDDNRAYQPQYQSRAELNYSNDFLRRFPRGDFEMKAAAVYEYRGHVTFPLAAGDVVAGTAKTLSALLEIRILRAVISYQQRNIMGYQYQIIPGFEMPRVLAIYGVRWEFWN